MDWYEQIYESATTATTSTTAATGTMTIADIERSMGELRELLAKKPEPKRSRIGSIFPSALSVGGVPIIKSPFAMTDKPNRAHKKRRNQSASYHARIQKKWTKRFGTHMAPGAYMISGAGLGFNDETALAIHPSMYDGLLSLWKNRYHHGL